MALVNCTECGKEISDLAAACPGCGAPARQKMPARGSYVPYSDQEVAVMLSKRKKTSHLLHLILSLITFGLWIFIWLLVGISNANENAKIDAKIKKGKKVK